jgi:hypothetical protein
MFFITFGLITTYKILTINISTHNYVYEKIFQLIHQYENSTIQILHKTKLKCTKDGCLNRLFVFSIISYHKTMYKFQQIDINTLNCIYYKIL